MPQYLKDHPVYYAGPAKTPEGYASGSFGPTTAGRMDSYVEQFQAAGGSKVMLAKGNRSRQVTEACNAHGGFYLGSIGGPAARLAQDCIKKVEVLEYEELGMEAVWRIEVKDFPAFVVVDDKGNDFFTGKPPRRRSRRFRCGGRGWRSHPSRGRVAPLRRKSGGGGPHASVRGLSTDRASRQTLRGRAVAVLEAGRGVLGGQGDAEVLGGGGAQGGAGAGELGWAGLRSRRGRGRGRLR